MSRQFVKMRVITAYSLKALPAYSFSDYASSFVLHKYDHGLYSLGKSYHFLERCCEFWHSKKISILPSDRTHLQSSSYTATCKKALKHDLHLDTSLVILTLCKKRIIRIFCLIN